MTRTDVVVNEPQPVAARDSWPHGLGPHRTPQATRGSTSWVSADCHCQRAPRSLGPPRIDEKYRHRVPKVITPTRTG